MCDICTLTLFNIGVQALSILLNLAYFIGTFVVKSLHIDNDGTIDDIKVFKESLELYLNAVEYTSLAMIPLQITLIVMLKCCCKNVCASCCTTCCHGCILDEDDFVDKSMHKMNMHKSEITL